MPEPGRADSRYLREVAYADPSGLGARASLYDFQQPYVDLQSEALALLEPLDGRVVGDVGCGDGRYIDALRGAGARVVGIDLSVGMLAGVSSPGGVARGRQSGAAAHRRITRRRDDDAHAVPRA
jgi:SAM-dependent methyltransferase